MESLLEQARRLVAESKGTWRKLETDTGISYSWISKFHQGHIANPAYFTLVKIVEYFDKQGEEDDQKTNA